MAYKEYILAAGIRTDDFFKKASRINAVVEELEDKTVMVKVDMNNQSTDDIREFITEIEKTQPKIAVQVEYDFAENQQKQLFAQQDYYNKLLAHRQNLADFANRKDTKKAKAEGERELALMIKDLTEGVDAKAPVEYLQELYHDIYDALNAWDIQFGDYASEKIDNAFAKFEDMPIFEDIGGANLDVNYFVDINESIEKTKSKIESIRQFIKESQEELARLSAKRAAVEKESSKQAQPQKEDKKKQDNVVREDEELSELEARAKALAAEIGAAYDAYKAKLGEIPAEYQPIIEKTDELVERIESIDRLTFGARRVDTLIRKLEQATDASGNLYDNLKIKHGKSSTGVPSSNGAKSGSNTTKRNSDSEDDYTLMVRNELRDTISASESLLSLFNGKNPIVDLVNFWQNNDNILMRAVQSTAEELQDFTIESLLERAAIIGSDGKIYGAGTYHNHKSTAMSQVIQLPPGVTPLIDAHSHSASSIASSSTAKFEKETGKIEGDILAWAEGVKDGAMKYALTVARDSIQFFNAEAFYKNAAKNIDFSDIEVQRALAVNTVARNDYLSQRSMFALDRMSDDFSKDGNGFVNGIGSLLNSKGLKISVSKVVDNFRDIITKEFADTIDLGSVLSEAINRSMSSGNQGKIKFRFSESEILDAIGLAGFTDTQIKTYQKQAAVGGVFNGQYNNFLTEASKRQLAKDLGLKQKDISKYNVSLGIKNADDYMQFLSKDRLQNNSPVDLRGGFDISSVSEMANVLSSIVGSLRIVDESLKSIVQSWGNENYKTSDNRRKYSDENDVDDIVNGSIKAVKTIASFRDLQQQAAVVKFGKNGTSAADELIKKYREYQDKG